MLVLMIGLDSETCSPIWVSLTPVTMADAGKTCEVIR